MPSGGINRPRPQSGSAATGGNSRSPRMGCGGAILRDSKLLLVRRSACPRRTTVAWTAPSRSLLGQIPALDGDPRNFEPPFAPRHRRQRSAPASCSRPRARSALIARSVPGGSSDSAGRNRSSVSRIYANSNFNRLRRKLVMEPMEWGQTLAIDQPFSDRAWAWQTKALPLSSLAAPSSALSWASSSPSPLPIYEPGAPITWR